MWHLGFGIWEGASSRWESANDVATVASMATISANAIDKRGRVQIALNAMQMASSDNQMCSMDSHSHSRPLVTAHAHSPYTSTPPSTYIPRRQQAQLKVNVSAFPAHESQINVSNLKIKLY